MIDDFINKTFYGDCLDIMPTIPEKSIDLIICDLPYGTTKCLWDIIIPFDHLWKNYNRIAKNKTAIILFGNEPFSSLLRLSNLKIYKQDLYWQKERPVNILQLKRRFGKTIENIIIFYKNQCTYNPQKYKASKYIHNRIGNGRLGNLIDEQNKKAFDYKDTGWRYPKDVLYFNRDSTGKGNNTHPTKKPLALVEYLIKTYSNEEDIVLDNCAGSGTTGEACIKLKRKYILIEKEKQFYDIIIKRLSNIKAIEQNLFLEKDMQ
jgi:site-specific DNA-methyltransferase (adenine-specific)